MLARTVGATGRILGGVVAGIALGTHLPLWFVGGMFVAVACSIIELRS